MWRGLSLALGAFLFATAPAMANSGSITGVAPVTDGIFTATFQAASDRCDLGGACGWFEFATMTDSAESCDLAASRIYTGETQDTPGTSEATGVAFYPDTEGPFKLCLYIARRDAVDLVAEYVYTPPAPLAGPAQRLTLRDARDAARNYLGQRFGAWPGRVARLLVACRRVDIVAFRCRVGWRSGGDRYRGTVTVRAVSGSELRVRAAVRRRG